MSQALALYTDGSARPNPGFAGWGVHGYLYINEKPKKGTGHKTHLVTSIGYRSKLDGLAKENEVTPIKYYDGSGTIPSPNTNNTAELKAALEALKLAIKEDVKQVIVYSDSKMVVEGIKGWVKKWNANGWITNSGKPVGSQELWKELDSHKTILESNGVKVGFEWVKGHGDNPGNIQADKLAVVGTLRSTRGENKTQWDMSDPTGYWKAEVERNPLLDFKGLFFNTLTGYNTPGLYYLSNKDKEEEFLGSNQPDSAYAVVKLKDPDDIIEYIRGRQSKLADDGVRDLLVLGKLSSVFNANIYNDIIQYGDSVLDRTKNGWDMIHATSKEPITRVLQPPLLAMRAIECLSHLDAKLEEYQNDQSNLCITDITPFFYDEVEVKKGKKTLKTHKLKEEYVVGYAKREFDINYKVKDKVNTSKLILTFGVDIVNRNALKRIEGQNPVIHVITWMESDLMLRYATVIKTDHDITILSASHSNLKLISP